MGSRVPGGTRTVTSTWRSCAPSSRARSHVRCAGSGTCWCGLVSRRRRGVPWLTEKTPAGFAIIVSALVYVPHAHPVVGVVCVRPWDAPSEPPSDTCVRWMGHRRPARCGGADRALVIVASRVQATAVGRERSGTRRPRGLTSSHPGAPRRAPGSRWPRRSQAAPSFGSRLSGTGLGGSTPGRLYCSAPR